MARVELAELAAFVAVADHLSFTRAAHQLGLSLPTVSLTVKALEDRLDVRLFNRTTRSVALTEAGERLLAEIQPLLQGVDDAIESVNRYRDKPIGTLRLAVSRTFATRVLAQLIKPFLDEYPEIRLDLEIDDTNIDIVRHRFDAGIRVGDMVERDMKVISVFDPFRLIVVASPVYLAGKPAPVRPEDLRGHNCIRYRLPHDGSIQRWIVERSGRQTEIAVEGSLIVNDFDLMMGAALDGVGVAYLSEPLIQGALADRKLIRVLPGWGHTLQGIYLYHPSRRQVPMPLLVFLRFIKEWRKTK
ncbi:LysR family transcriptional regulator [Rhodopseudomonas palustris]|uniref:Transcriptional regulator, LysR family n=1 Tax=Rhodopseudomonas palustris (strain BisB18) TaxID=316056 RepID=Q216Y6_RHOPB